MAELEARLAALSGGAFPPAPDLAGAVGARLRAGEAPRPRRLTRGRAVALAFAALLLPAAAVAAVPGARHSVLDWLGLRHVRVERLPRVPHLPPLHRVDLGARVGSTAAAARRAGFAVEVPRALGRPDAVYVARGGIVSLAYGPRPHLPRDPNTGFGVLITELRALHEPDLLKKVVGPGTRVEPVHVRGAFGVFISGEVHEVLVERRGEGVIPIPPRTAGNTLAFERGELVVRIEGRFGKARALPIARSIRP